MIALLYIILSLVHLVAGKAMCKIRQEAERV